MWRRSIQSIVNLEFKDMILTIEGNVLHRNDTSNKDNAGMRDVFHTS